MGRKLDVRECLRRMAEPEEKARAGAHMASDGHDMIVGRGFYLIHQQKLGRL
jgi:hypothetical protein